MFWNNVTSAYNNVEKRFKSLLSAFLPLSAGVYSKNLSHSLPFRVVETICHTNFKIVKEFTGMLYHHAYAISAYKRLVMGYGVKDTKLLKLRPAI